MAVEGDEGYEGQGERQDRVHKGVHGLPPLVERTPGVKLVKIIGANISKGIR